jgi:ferritin-like metal-binding protein YciE
MSTGTNSKDAEKCDGVGIGEKGPSPTTHHPLRGDMSMESLKDLLVHDLKDLRDAEKQIIRALPKMADAASAPALRKALGEHLEVTKKQLDRLDQILEEWGESPGRKKCKGMQGLIKEGEELLEEEAEPSVLDAGLVTAAQKVEHYEMAAYGSARAYAAVLGDADVTRLLQRSLDEEGEADKTLTAIAERMINARAAAEGNGKRG